MITCVKNMGLIEEYKQQYGWRDWETAIRSLPLGSGQLVLDLGCAIGDQSAVLASHGVRVIGIDANEELLREANSRHLKDVSFRQGNLSNIEGLGELADGIWCSFTAAYFTDLMPVLRNWNKHLRPGGWIALTEIDDLFGHDPLSCDMHKLLEGYASHAFSNGWYDFYKGRKLRSDLEALGCNILNETYLSDKELSFTGCASSEVLLAWKMRFERMKALQSFAGPEFATLKKEFLACLSNEQHSSNAKVYYCLARKPKSV